jgi:hypothetical protein
MSVYIQVYSQLIVQLDLMLLLVSPADSSHRQGTTNAEDT